MQNLDVEVVDAALCLMCTRHAVQSLDHATTSHVQQLA